MPEPIPTTLPAQELAVRTRGLTKRYGRVAAVTGLDLTVPEGAFYLLLGPNGAGKTTTFRMLMGNLRPTSGSAEVAGVTASPAGQVRVRMGFVPEHQDGPYGWMRTGDLIRHHAGYFPAWNDAYARRLADAFELRPEVRYGKLSKGQARRVQLLMALAHTPPVLLLDEPTDGLDPVARDTVQAILAEHLAGYPTTVIVATHLVYEMERFADYVGVLGAGRLVAQMERATLQAQLRRYVLDVAEDWHPPLEAELPLLRQNGTPRERRWTIWGPEEEVTRRLSAAGARVRSVSALNLDEAALALLSRKENR